MVARAVPTTSTLTVPHRPASVGIARRRLRSELGDHEIPDHVIDDAVLVLSELLSNSCRYARPLLEDEDDAEEPGQVLVRWQTHDDGQLTLEVTDGGASTRPLPASPSLTARGGRGLSIVGKLAGAWGVRNEPGAVTVWAVIPGGRLADPNGHARSA